MMSHGIPIALVLLGACAAGASGQAAAYRRTPGDTLRYHSTMSMVTETEGSPTGPMQITMAGETWMTVAFAPADTVRFWMDKGSMKMTTPMGEMQPPIDAMMKRPWVALMSPTGKLEMITSPELIAPGTPGADLVGNLMPKTMQIFMVLPTEPMRIGLTWADSTEDKSTASHENQTSMRSRTQYTVAKDSTLDGEQVFIIEKTGKTEMEMNISRSAGGSTMYMKNSMAGDVTGRVFFAPAKGVILKQADLMIMKGTQQMEGLMSMSTNSTQRMESTMTLVR